MAINQKLRRWLAQTLADNPGISQVELARLLTNAINRQYDRSKINKMILGKRNITHDESVAIARALSVALPSQAPDVPLVGFVEAGAVLHILSGVQQDPHEVVEGPMNAGPDTVAVRVRGDSMYGIADDGWLLFYEQRHETPTSELINKLCVVGLADGRVVVKKLRRGVAPNTYDLHSTNAAPMENVQVEWCAKVRWIEQP